jgi:hypothetical protein
LIKKKIGHGPKKSVDAKLELELFALEVIFLGQENVIDSIQDPYTKLVIGGNGL